MDPDGASGAEPSVESEPLVESSPAAATTAAATAPDAGVEVVPAPNREGSRGRLKRSQREAEHTRLKTSPRRI